MADNYDTISYDKAHGRVITRVYDADHGWLGAECGTQVPESNMLFNFVVKFHNFEVKFGPNYGTKTFVILDPYGDDLLAGDSLNRKLFGNTDHRTTVGIDLQDGKIYHVAFGEEGPEDNRRVVMVYFAHVPGADREGQLTIPEEYIKHLPELRTKKRPFQWFLDERATISFIEQEVGFSSLREALSLELRFDDFSLQLAPLGSEETLTRTVSLWK